VHALSLPQRAIEDAEGYRLELNLRTDRLQGCLYDLRQFLVAWVALRPEAEGEAERVARAVARRSQKLARPRRGVPKEANVNVTGVGGADEATGRRAQDTEQTLGNALGVDGEGDGAADTLVGPHVNVIVEQERDHAVGRHDLDLEVVAPLKQADLLRRQAG